MPTSSTVATLPAWRPRHSPRPATPTSLPLRPQTSRPPPAASRWVGGRVGGRLGGGWAASGRRAGGRADGRLGGGRAASGRRAGGQTGAAQQWSLSVTELVELETELCFMLRITCRRQEHAPPALFAASFPLQPPQSPPGTLLPAGGAVLGPSWQQWMRGYLCGTCCQRVTAQCRPS